MLLIKKILQLLCRLAMVRILLILLILRPKDAILWENSWVGRPPTSAIISQPGSPSQPLRWHPYWLTTLAYDEFLRRLTLAF
jgi:hypothetical protein